MKENISKIIGWLGTIFFLLAGFVYVGESVSGFLFFLLAILFCPLFINYLQKVNKKPKLFYRIIIGFVLFFVGIAFTPNTADNAVKEVKTSQKVVESNIDDVANEQETKKELEATKEKNVDNTPGIKDELLTKTQDTTKESEVAVTPGIKESTNISSVKSKVVDQQTDTTTMKVHFIDVDQGDSILIESAGKYMLVDAGENNKADTVVAYLKSVGVKTLEYVIGTHPHSDHIGGLDKVIESFTVKKVIMPNKSNDTQTFEDVITAISKKGLKITKPIVGTNYSIGDASFTIIAPNAPTYSNINNYSVGIKIENGNNAFVMLGDAELESEYDALENGIDLSADVFKLGHHGSDTATSEAILKAVNPSYALISVGKDNQYGHPHDETLKRLKDRNVKLYRTDLAGTIIATSNGEKISFNTKATTIQLDKTILSPQKKTSSSTKISAKEDTKDKTVYVTKTGSKYHRDGCEYLKKSKIEIDLEDAKKDHDPCSKCNPPQ